MQRDFSSSFQPHFRVAAPWHTILQILAARHRTFEIHLPCVKGLAPILNDIAGYECLSL